MLNLIWFALVGLVVGWLASLLVHGKGMGILPNMVVGILGAVIGVYLAQMFHIPSTGFLGNLGFSVLGAVVLLVVIRIIKSS